MHPRCLALVAIALAAPLTPGQINPAIGRARGATDDSVVGPLSLSFPFTLPDGTVTRELFADSNGRVFADSSERSDFAESESELDSDPSQIAVYWDDLTPLNGSAIADVYFNDLGSSALVSWVDVSEHAAPPGSEFSVQVELFPDGAFVIRSDRRVPASDAIVGCSVGGSAGLPDLVDLSIAAPFDSGTEGTVFESFDGFNVSFDLIGCSTRFAPNGRGGYAISSNCSPGTPRPVRSEVLTGPRACAPIALLNKSVEFTRGASSAYLSSSNRGVATLDFASGTPLGLGDDTVAVVSLPFGFPMPGGPTVNAVAVDSNGRLSEPGRSVSDSSEAVDELLNAPSATLCPFWDDFDPSAGGEVWVGSTVDGGVAITWDRVPQFGVGDQNSFQVQLRPSGDLVFYYFAMDAMDGLVGISAGRGVVDPGSRDLSARVSGAMFADVRYQLFAGSESNDLGMTQVLPVLANLTRPVLGRSLDVEIHNDESALARGVLLGAPIMVGFDAIGVPCVLHCDGSLGELVSAGPNGRFAIALPVLRALAGQSFTMQGLTVDRAAGNPLGVLLTNPLELTIGDY